MKPVCYYRPEVLNEGPIPDERIEIVNMSGKVDVEQEIVFHFFQESQTFPILRFVETENDLKYWKH